MYISLLEHFHPHKHIYNAQTYKIMNEHIYIGKITKYRKQGWNKAKYQIWNFVRLTFVKKSTAFKSIRFMKHTARTGPIKNPGNYISQNCPKLCSWSRRPAIIFENQKEGLTSWGDQQAYYLQVSIEFTSHRQKTSRVVVLSFRPLINSITYRDQRSNLQTIYKTRFVQTHIKDLS